MRYALLDKSTRQSYNIFLIYTSHVSCLFGIVVVPLQSKSHTMQYSQAIFQIAAQESFVQDILVAQLAEIGFETFENPTEDSLVAYIQTDTFSETALQDLLAAFPFAGITLQETSLCENIDWNAEWEKHYFEPILIGNECVIHSSFHKDLPHCQYDIIIDPKMAFGTGHHQTTSLILTELLSMDLQGKSLLDMGCGTAVLAILASLRGANPITAVDIDNWCTENAVENMALNNITNIEVILGDARVLEGKHFDIILANINRNILLMDMERYVACLNAGGTLIMSGFYTEDIPLLEAKANKLGMHLVAQHSKDNWAMVKMEL